MFVDLSHFSYAAIQTTFTFLLLYWHIWVKLLICLNIIIRVTTSANTRDVNACSYKDKCCFSHDIEAFMAQKPADLEGDYPFIKADAPCPYGLACRFASTHKDNTPAVTSNLLKKSSEQRCSEAFVEKQNALYLTGYCITCYQRDNSGPNWKVKKLVDKEEDEVGLDGSHAADETNCKNVVDETANTEEACETDKLRPLKKAKLVVDKNALMKGKVIDFLWIFYSLHFLLEWLSYACRYIAVGILDVIPQRLNWRPPSYYGRDDLETLMASDSTADWIRISKMLLGKVQDGFTFALKHKSNAYDRAKNS
ncbi:hypothetical protein CXB51_025244 [Gossypium anomalum]|uniref:C3H1-type domain-containing protein n=1 Tax=Gossypium anomalum TaxID=47600 RepID=A0A8J5YDU8_9ROSI|nr:hypothetical protein CXB51_025244 [Gossypium anomalum]